MFLCVLLVIIVCLVFTVHRVPGLCISSWPRLFSLTFYHFPSASCLEILVSFSIFLEVRFNISASQNTHKHFSNFLNFINTLFVLTVQPVNHEKEKFSIFKQKRRNYSFLQTKVYTKQTFCEISNSIQYSMVNEF